MLQDELDLNELLTAVQKFREKVVYVKAKHRGVHGKYAPLKDVVMDTKDALKENGLVVVQTLTHWEGRAALYTRLTHQPSKQNLQSVHVLAYQGDDSMKQGSAITYARRYGYNTILGLLVDQDDDGALASAKTEAKTDVASFYEAKSNLTKHLTKLGIKVADQKKLVLETLGKDKVESLEEVELVKQAADKS